jgi:hypothetical protein
MSGRASAGGGGVGADVIVDQCQQAVVLGAAGGAHGQMHRDATEPGSGVAERKLGLDVAIEHHARRRAARVAVVDREHRFQEVADAAVAR